MALPHKFDGALGPLTPSGAQHHLQHPPLEFSGPTRQALLPSLMGSLASRSVPVPLTSLAVPCAATEPPKCGATSGGVTHRRGATSGGSVVVGRRLLAGTAGAHAPSHRRTASAAPLLGNVSVGTITMTSIASERGIRTSLLLAVAAGCWANPVCCGGVPWMCTCFSFIMCKRTCRLMSSMVPGCGKRCGCIRSANSCRPCRRHVCCTLVLCAATQGLLHTPKHQGAQREWRAAAAANSRGRPSDIPAARPARTSRLQPRQRRPL